MSSPVAGTSTGFGNNKVIKAPLASSSPGEDSHRTNRGVISYSPLPSPIPGTSNSQARRHWSLSPRRIALLHNKKNLSTSLSCFLGEIEKADEEERSAQRKVDQNNNSSLSISSNSTSILNLSLSSEEVKNHISKCLRLNAMNKINDQNAFELKMIDFLASSLKNQNPSIDLSLASAYLDVSKMIYGHRVDRVHSDLLKIIGVSRSRKRKHSDDCGDHEQDGDNSDDRHEISIKRKRKKKSTNIISSIEGLRKEVETCDQQLQIQVGRDALTSDMLLQLYPQQVNENNILNYTNLPVIDRTLCDQPHRDGNHLTLTAPTTADFTSDKLSSYAQFSFLHQNWLPDNSEENNNSYVPASPVSLSQNSNENTYSGDLVNNNFDHYDACSDLHVNASIHDAGFIFDFVEEISNNADGNKSSEYSYLRQKYIRWSGPAHWKFIFKKRPIDDQGETCHLAKRSKKEVELTFTNKKLKDSIALKFTQSKSSNRLSDETVIRSWSDEKVSQLPRYMSTPSGNLCKFFNRLPNAYVKYAHHECVENDPHSESIESIDTIDEQPYHSSETEVDENDIHLTGPSIGNFEAFTGNNLIELPKRMNAVPIAYSLRAKKVDMHELKDAIKKIIEIPQHDKSNVSQSKMFSDIYLNLPNYLSKANAISLSPALGFVSLMHVANEDHLLALPSKNLSDVLIVQK